MAHEPEPGRGRHDPQPRGTQGHGAKGQGTGRQGTQRQSTDLPNRIEALAHDLRQCIMAGLLLAELPSKNHLDQETRRRLDLLRQTLSYARTLLEQVRTAEPPEHWVLDLADLAEQSAILAEYRHQVRVLDESCGRAMVCAEPVLLQRAVDNLIDNASRAAGECGAVVIRVGASDDEAWLEVVDDGPGFGRIEHGSGQGLSVVSSAVQDCNGRLQITSGPGPGTTVRMILPRRPGSDGD